jgi:phosphatidylinositol glycan class C protein
MSNGGWEKVLWKSQPYPDNYIHPDTFLSSLRRNRTFSPFFEYHGTHLVSTANFRPLTYWPLVRAACAITQHLTTIFIFLAVFVRLRERLLDPRLLVWVSIACFLIGYLVWWEFVLGHSRVDRKVRRTQRACYFCVNDNVGLIRWGTDVKASILMFVMLMSLSPVLKTLSAATSSDSIWALSAFLFMLNVLLADYTSFESAGKVRIRQVLSLRLYIQDTEFSKQAVIGVVHERGHILLCCVGVAPR